MQVVSGVNSRPFRPSLSYMTHLRPLIATTLIMGKDRGINGTAGIKTKFDGPSRESGTESMVYLRHPPMEIGRGAMWTAHPVEVRPMSYQSPSSLTTEYVPNRM